ncbi:GTPase IMAP family member [Trichinella spiralis]|uniref:GTPase IMAP family member n=1 Tax=Trichinella spiralis TaxID=6334 RepID=A0ABR3KLQ5_TRISP
MNKPGYQTDHAQGVGDRFGSQEAYCGSGSQKTMPIDKQFAEFPATQVRDKFVRLNLLKSSWSFVLVEKPVKARQFRLAVPFSACSKFCQNRSALFVIAIMVIKDAQMVHYETREAANYVTYTNAGRHLLTFQEPLDRYIGPLHTQMIKRLFKSIQ